MVGLPDAISATQELATELSPAPVTFNRVSSAKALKRRLDWGKPDLTIIDVRDRRSFNQERITGAILVSLDALVHQVKNTLETSRDIYIYGTDDGDIINAASQLDAAGFHRVAILEGGLQEWKLAQGPTEGRAA
ncbi:rhodanese-like domain-containing protein [Leptolyngbya iicbica]|uniref:Rhodanese-like domain-containing protein n=2 Tax=Cyanophyceae TaxID=3028117 RepID=A0A4Q7E7G3_9CYAN|nr:rhodanese-like domain-containing protein [Leptolyngbya sp. LK]RZM78697.1 rhodanese-like domain-containing protein [Leptolyngbya sp. LK]